MTLDLRPIVTCLIMIAPMCAVSGLAKAYDCVEVETFQVDRSHIKSKKDKRAAHIPAGALAELRQSIVLEVPLSVPGMVGMYAGDESCPNAESAIILGGTMSDFKKGNKAARYWVGMGAGAQKFAVQAWIKDKTTGETLGTAEVVDRKIAGFVGGSDEKGVDDFSEKVTRFIRRTLGKSK